MPQNKIRENYENRPDIINIKVTFEVPKPGGGDSKMSVGYISMKNGEHSKNKPENICNYSVVKRHHPSSAAVTEPSGKILKRCK